MPEPHPPPGEARSAAGQGEVQQPGEQIIETPGKRARPSFAFDPDAGDH